MGRGYVITNSRSTDRGFKKKTVKRDLVIGPNAIKFITIIIAAVLAVVYLGQSTAGAGRSVKTRGIESRKGDLMLEKERLETEQTRLKSLKEIDGNIEKPALEPVSGVDHLGGDKQIAQNN